MDNGAAMTPERRRHRKLTKLAIALGLLVVLLSVSGFAGIRWHETPQFCAAFCHLMDPYLESYTGQTVSAKDNSPLLAQAHAEEGVICLDCHKPTLEQQLHELVTYVKGDYRTPLERRKVADEECLACKEHATRDELIEKTADYQMEYHLPETLLVKIAESGYDLEQERNTNPHEYRVSALNPYDPHAENGSYPACSRCHSMHRESLKIEYCFGCHHSGTYAPCDTCHELRTRTG